MKAMKSNLVAMQNGPKSGKEGPKLRRLDKIKPSVGKSYWDNLNDVELATLEPKNGVFTVAGKKAVEKAKKAQAKKKK